MHGSQIIGGPAWLAVLDDKNRFVAEWIAANGTPEQQDRQSKGLLPFEEAREAIADKMFEALRDWMPP